MVMRLFHIAAVHSCFLVNSADRTIRVYESGEVLACGKDGEPEPIQKLQDLVNRLVSQTRHRQSVTSAM